MALSQQPEKAQNLWSLKPAMPNVTLVANDQEQGINTLLEPDKITRNPIGDFVFYIGDEPILYIERKTGNDYWLL